MLRRNEGFFLAELLMSLAALCIAILFLLPAASLITEKGEEGMLKRNARQLVYSELLKLAGEGIEPKERVEIVDGRTYRIYVQYGNGGREVCVENDARPNRIAPICAEIE